MWTDLANGVVIKKAISKPYCYCNGTVENARGLAKPLQMREQLMQFNYELLRRLLRAMTTI